jgi:predicted amidophosphoribosyltransferase
MQFLCALVRLDARRFVFSSSREPIRVTETNRGVTRGRIFASLVWVLRSSAESLFATFFPSDCRLCDVPLTNIARLPVCEECLSQIPPLTGGMCEVCGKRLPTLHILSSQCADQRCGLCRRIEPPFTKATAYGSYHGVIRDLIHLLKYELVRPAANVLGRMLARAIAKIEPSLGASLLAVPVPLHSRKLRHRGFNQSELIARAALKLGPARQRWLFSTAVLERTRETQSQIGLTRHQRRENPRGAFSIIRPAAIRGEKFCSLMMYYDGDDTLGVRSASTSGGSI